MIEESCGPIAAAHSVDNFQARATALRELFATIFRWAVLCWYYRWLVHLDLSHCLDLRLLYERTHSLSIRNTYAIAVMLLQTLFNIDNGYLEGLIRGFKNGILKQTDYLNLVQCETLEGGFYLQL